MQAGAQAVPGGTIVDSKGGRRGGDKGNGCTHKGPRTGGILPLS